MKVITRSISFLIFAVLLFSVNGFSQATANSYKILSNSTMTLYGTSTLHSFTVNADEISGYITMQEQENGFQLGQSTKLDVTIPVKELKTEKESMNDNMYDALKADDNPNITYMLQSINPTEIPCSTKDSVEIKTTGILTIAGVSKTVDVDVYGSRTKSGDIEFKGEKKVKMTDFGVKPPTMFFGTIKVGDEITVAFDLLVSNK
jgi:polyisoprenoid-binding protein YceI